MSYGRRNTATGYELRRLAERSQDRARVRIGPHQHLAGSLMAWIFAHRGAAVLDEAIEIEHVLLPE
jgi:hypothetical protein